ncbi:MAG: asparagine synthase (glutamine-hydrolyzing), partial [Myxococcota bacterium]
MCGLAGQLSHDGESVDAEAVLAKIAHRGPDARGSEHIRSGGAEVWLGHTRLSILDLTDAGAQPMISRDGRWWLTFNGEVYNHQTLREGLSVDFRGHSDTESIVESLSHRGIDETLRRLNGMYAFAALDRRERRLYLARDPFGIKPLYYSQTPGRIRFASEIGALKAMGVGARLDSDALQTFLTLRYTPSPQTLLAGISRLPPGHMLVHDLPSRDTSTRCFISPQSERFEGTQEEAVTAYESALRDAVGRQLLSDVPVGLLLSGGIDSALIAAMALEAGTKLTGFTVGFGGDHEECEISDAAHTAQVLGLPHRSVTVDPEQLWTSLPQIVRSVEEPLGTTSILPMWSLVAAARSEVTVVLTGQGSDEPWGGYR